jgi:hypothetical protein
LSTSASKDAGSFPRDKSALVGEVRDSQAATLRETINQQSAAPSRLKAARPDA